MHQTRQIIRTTIVGLILAVALAACGGGTAQETAQRFAEAVVREDYRAARAFFDPSLSEGEVTSLIASLRGDLVDRHGALRSASAAAPQPGGSEDEALILITWQLERADVANGWVLRRGDDGWRITTFWPFGQVVGRLQPGGAVATMTPAPTPQPTARDLDIKVDWPASGAIEPWQTPVVTIVETGEQQTGKVVRFAQLPLGTYTVRLDITGRAPSETTVEIRGDQPPPDPLVVSPGPALPFDATRGLFTIDTRFGSPSYTYAELTPDGLAQRWTVRAHTPPVLSDDGATVRFVGPEGIGHIDASGIITWDWQPPSDGADWAYRPDKREIAYIANRDVWTVTTTTGAAPTRWTELGIFEQVLGWADNDALVLRTDRDLRLLRRDGSGYTVSESIYFGPELLSDRAGVVRMVRDDGQMLRLGATELAPIADLPTESLGDVHYGWTRDNRYYLIHRNQSDGRTSGIAVISPDGTFRQVLPELTARASMFSSSLDDQGPAAFAPASSRMALGWWGETNGGIYIVDAADGSARQVSEARPNTLFWIDEQRIIYVIEDGEEMGTWLLPLDGQQPRKLFAYRAERASVAPDGGVLLVANSTLWHSTDSGEPVPVGAEGSYSQGVGLAPLARATPAPTDSRPAPTPAAQPSPGEPEPLTPAATFAWEEAPAGQASAGNPPPAAAAQATDGRPETAWRAPGDGVGQEIILMFDRAVQLSELRIVPGDAATDPLSGESLFGQHRRVRQVRLEFSGGTTVPANLAERPEPQPITFDPVVTSFVRIVITQTTPPGAASASDFTPISEIVALGQRCELDRCGTVGEDISALVAAAGGPNLGVKVEGLDGDYARLTLIPLDRTLDAPIAFARRAGAGWEVVSIGTAFEPASLAQLGVPETLWP